MKSSEEQRRILPLKNPAGEVDKVTVSETAIALIHLVDTQMSEARAGRRVRT
jgi:hypothetical protein